ncbi:SMC5-SMC6 complex localization factor protein 2 isoform X1 [Scleropages formosus]|uniref:SMC5-SMC6 complex localization factor protein 2-like n=2 Tax=Scleropages formosus TaxID=113540 RepID=A0A8C9RQB4_SCLFO|nr:SMC5-SMC6 complex localization factor protein 2-like isoform X1 [Scleropages formosus]
MQDRTLTDHYTPLATQQTQMTEQGEASTGQSKAPNRLREKFNSMVKDFIPLGVPRHVSLDHKDSTTHRPERQGISPACRNSASQPKQALFLTSLEVNLNKVKVSSATDFIKISGSSQGAVFSPCISGSGSSDHRKLQCPSENSPVCSSLLTLQSLGKRKVDSAGVDKRSWKRSCSTHVATSAKSAKDRFLRKQEISICRTPGASGTQDRSATVSLHAKTARQLFSERTQDQNCDSKENNGGLSKPHIQPIKSSPTQLFRPAESQATKHLHTQPAKCHEAVGLKSTQPCSLAEGPKDRPPPTCAVDSTSGPAVAPSLSSTEAVIDCQELQLDFGLGTVDCKVNSRKRRRSSSSSTSSSEDEPLLSLQEMLNHSTCHPSTPQKDAFSEPCTPLPKVPLPAFRDGRPINYRNTLEQMLKEKARNQKLKDVEKKLLYSKEDLLKLDEDDEGEGSGEEGISPEHRDILQRFSVVSSAIPDLHPGEDVFNLDNFGRLFSQHTLELKRCAVTPQNLAQKTLLQASSEQLPLLISAGLLLKAYRSAPCPPAVSSWLFRMMSVHADRKTSTQILQSMKDISLIAAEQIVLNQNKMFEIWTPGLKEVALTFLNMGVPFVTLFPLESLQPPFTEGDLLQSTLIFPEARTGEQKFKQGAFPKHNVENVIKYLEVSMALASRAYSDKEILLLLTAICKVSLETQLQLMPTEDVRALLTHLVDNTRFWDQQLPRICLALADLTEDHHNLRHLVQLLPNNKRGKQLRKHLSVSIISKLLNHRCTYKPTRADFQLADLQQYLPHMRPSALLRGLLAVKKEDKEDDDTISQDQQVYYLCYSLLILLNEASNFESFPSSQKNHLMTLCAELEKHIKCDIRESEKHLYRSKVKDLVARIYTRWQFLLQKSRPLQGKLYDYWQPPLEDVESTSQHCQSAGGEEGPLEDGEITSRTTRCEGTNKDVAVLSEIN